MIKLLTKSRISNHAEILAVFLVNIIAGKTPILFIIFAFLMPVNAFADITSCGPLSCESYNMYASPESRVCGVSCEDPNCAGSTEYKRYSFSCSDGTELNCCCCGCAPPRQTPTPTPTPLVTITPSTTIAVIPFSVILAK